MYFLLYGISISTYVDLTILLYQISTTSKEKLSNTELDDNLIISVRLLRCVLEFADLVSLDLYLMITVIRD